MHENLFFVQMLQNLYDYSVCCLCHSAILFLDYYKLQISLFRFFHSLFHTMCEYVGIYLFLNSFFISLLPSHPS